MALVASDDMTLPFGGPSFPDIVLSRLAVLSAIGTCPPALPCVGVGVNSAVQCGCVVPVGIVPCMDRIRGCVDSKRLHPMVLSPIDVGLPCSVGVGVKQCEQCEQCGGAGVRITHVSKSRHTENRVWVGSPGRYKALFVAESAALAAYPVVDSSTLIIEIV